MFLTQHIIDFAHRYRLNRERRRLEEIFSAIPEGVQKDLGWPSFTDLGPATSCKTRSAAASNVRSRA